MTPTADHEFVGLLLDEHAAALELYAAQWSEWPSDIVQQAFLQLVRQPAFPDRIVPWLYRVVRNAAISSARSSRQRRKRESEAASQASAWFCPDPVRQLDAQEAAEALRALPDEEREVIIAHLWGGLSFEEIAELVRSSASTAHRRYTAGIDTLRKKMGLPCLTKKNSPGI